MLERLRAGDARAFEDLVVAYQHRVFSIAYRMLGSRAEAEEAAQEVFLRAHRGLAGFLGDAKLSTWLFTITSRLCLNRLAAWAPDHEPAELPARVRRPPAPHALSGVHREIGKTFPVVSGLTR